MARSEQTVNPAIPTGRVEVRVERLELLSEADPLPFSVEDESQEASEELRLTYRYLDIRRPRRLRALEMRSRVASAMRRVLEDDGFLEVETPVLTRSTPEGARDFLVPSRLQQGSWYALPQSPQLFKQLLMVGGLERYYQIVRCFRDEDLRADRQPEFTQLDVEASFVEPADIQELIERVLVASFAAAGVAVTAPFPRITHADAMRRFGTDRPDMRFGMEILDWTGPAGASGFGVFEGAIGAGGVVRGLVVPGAGAGVSRRVGDELMEEARELGAKGLVWAAVEEDGSLRSPVARFLGSIADDLGAAPGDLIALVADAEPVAQAVLGTLRGRFAERHGLIPEDAWAPVWVVDFPLVEWNDAEGRWDSTHHPFTAPRPEDLDRLEDDPASVLSLAYDIVLNGLEIGGGSIRIHDRDDPGAGVRADRPERRGGGGQVRLPPAGAAPGRAAPRRHRPGPRPHRDAAGRRALDPRRDRLPEDRHRRRPAHRGARGRGRAAAARAGRALDGGGPARAGLLGPAEQAPGVAAQLRRQGDAGLGGRRAGRPRDVDRAAGLQLAERRSSRRGCRRGRSPGPGRPRPGRWRRRGRPPRGRPRPATA